MTLDSLIVRLGVIVGVLVGVAAVTIVGRSRLSRIRTLYRERTRTMLPYFGLLGGVLVVNKLTRRVGQDLSWVVGVNVTGVIYAIEGTFVASVQSVATPQLTAFFSFMYVYGYVFVLVFPLLAYFVLEDDRFLRETCLAYAFNYAIGLVCYVVFIAYGPRNLMPAAVESLLYVYWPESQLLTRQMNTNTNVFPSLHSSLSVTVVLLAYRTRDRYPVWLYIATFCSCSIVISTMYLGIHWATDVVAGIVLALVSVSIATALGAETVPRYRTQLSQKSRYERSDR